MRSPTRRRAERARGLSRNSSLLGVIDFREGKLNVGCFSGTEDCGIWRDGPGTSPLRVLRNLFTSLSSSE